MNSAGSLLAANPLPPVLIRAVAVLSRVRLNIRCHQHAPDPQKDLRRPFAFKNHKLARRLSTMVARRTSFRQLHTTVRLRKDGEGIRAWSRQTAKTEIAHQVMRALITKATICISDCDASWPGSRFSEAGSHTSPKIHAAPARALETLHFKASRTRIIVP